MRELHGKIIWLIRLQQIKSKRKTNFELLTNWTILRYRERLIQELEFDRHCDTTSALGDIIKTVSELDRNQEWIFGKQKRTKKKQQLVFSFVICLTHKSETEVQGCSEFFTWKPTIYNIYIHQILHKFGKIVQVRSMMVFFFVVNCLESTWIYLMWAKCFLF